MFPNNQKKYSSSSIVEPRQYIDYMRTVRKTNLYCPSRVVICYQRSLLSKIKNNYDSIKKGGVTIVNFDGVEIAVLGGFGIGAPAAVATLEEMIALGAKKIISIGSAGTLQKNISIGDIVLVDRAIRDEGTSHHYLPQSKYAAPSKNLTSCIADKMSSIDFHRGDSWTTDAPYRETECEVRNYQNEGVLTVEMEAAALFAVGEYRNVEIASLIMISDSLSEFKWNPKFSSIDDKMIGLFKYACEALKGEK